MHISKLSSKQLWIVSAVIPFVFVLSFLILSPFGEFFSVEVGYIIDYPIVGDILVLFVYPGVLLLDWIVVRFFPSSDIGVSMISNLPLLISFLVYTCTIRLFLDFTLKYFYKLKK